MTPHSEITRTTVTLCRTLPMGIACSTGVFFSPTVKLVRSRICGRTDKANLLGVVERLS
jgi:hypothetical protein